MHGFCANCARWFDQLNNFADELHQEAVKEIFTPRDTGVYFIKCHDFVKIGGTNKDAHGRLITLQVGNPYNLELIKFSAGLNEKEVQVKFDYLKHRGEWYHLTPELESYISAL